MACSGRECVNWKLRWLYKQVADSGRECDREQEVKWLHKQVAECGRECDRECLTGS